MFEPYYAPKEEAANQDEDVLEASVSRDERQVVTLTRNGDEPGLVNRPSQSL